MITLVFLLALGAAENGSDVLVAPVESMKLCREIAKTHDDQKYGCVTITTMYNAEKNIILTPNWKKFI